MAAMCELLDQQNRLLAEIRDRLAEQDDRQPVTDRGNEPDGTVELKEPAVPAAASAPSAADEQAAATSDEPAAPTRAARKPAAKKTTTAARRRATKETS